MSASTPRGDLLLKDGDARPFLLIEFEQPADEADDLPRIALSWGDQIEDDDVESALTLALAVITGVEPDLLGRVVDALRGNP